MNRWLVCCVLLVSLSTFAQSSTVVTRSFMGQDVRLVIPTGYCLIDRDDSAGRVLYEIQEKGNQGNNQVAVLFADCQQWAAQQADPTLSLRKHGSYLFQFLGNGSQKALVPSALSNSDYVSEILQSITKSPKKLSATDLTKLKAVVNKKLADQGVTSGRITGDIRSGLLGFNDQALFFYGQTTNVFPTGTLHNAVVFALTMSRRVPVSINLIAEYDPVTNFTELLAQQEQLVRDFLNANE